MKKILLSIVLFISVIMSMFGVLPSYNSRTDCYWERFWPYVNEYYLYRQNEVAIQIVDDYLYIVGRLKSDGSADTLTFEPTAMIRRGRRPFGVNQLSEDSCIYVYRNKPEKSRYETVSRKLLPVKNGLDVINEFNLSPSYPLYHYFFHPNGRPKTIDEIISLLSQFNDFTEYASKYPGELISPIDTARGPEPSRLALYRKRKLGVYMPHERGAVVGTLHFREEGDTITFMPRVYIDPALQTHLCDSMAPSPDIAPKKILIYPDSMVVLTPPDRRRVYRK